MITRIFTTTIKRKILNFNLIKRHASTTSRSLSLMARTSNSTISNDLSEIRTRRKQKMSVLAHSRSDSFGFDPKLERQKFKHDVEEKSAFERVEWASKNYPGHVAMTTSFGIDSAVLLHLASTLIPDIPVIYVDTGFAPKETYQYAQTLQEELDLNLFVTTSAITPNRMLALYGELWNEDHSSYGRMRKVEPLRGAIRDLDVRCLLVGLRGNQTKHRASLPALSVRGVLVLVSFLIHSLRVVTHITYTTNRLTRVTRLCPLLATIPLECYGNT